MMQSSSMWSFWNNKTNDDDDFSWNNRFRVNSLAFYTMNVRASYYIVKTEIHASKLQRISLWYDTVQCRYNVSQILTIGIL